MCAVLADLAPPASALGGLGFREWLEEYDAEQSWVFDQAPAHVTPTKNVVGHVQMRRAAAPDRLAIGKLFVARVAHADGIRRHLLKEAAKYVQAQGKVPVVDLRESPGLTSEFCERYGFVAEPAAGHTVLRLG